MELPIEMNQNMNSNSSVDNKCTVEEQDQFMPVVNMVEIPRKILPPLAKISDDAKETMQECVSKFINFITEEANDHCQQEKRKTITAEGLLFAMITLRFGDCIEVHSMYLQRYREFDGGERNSLGSVQMMMTATGPVNYSIALLALAFLVHQPGFYGLESLNGFFMNHQVQVHLRLQRG